MEVHLAAYGVPVIVAAASVPMILGKVRRNWLFGFRTPRTLSSDETWYPANRAAGWFLAIAASISLCFNLTLWWSAPVWQAERLIRWWMGGNLVPLSAAIVASFFYLRRL